MIASSPFTSTIQTSSIWPGSWFQRAGSSPGTPQLPKRPWSHSLNTASSGTWRVTAFPAKPSTVISTGSEASRDAWAPRAATSSSTVVAGVSGLVVDHWQGSPYTYTPSSPGKTINPAPSGASEKSCFWRIPPPGSPYQSGAGIVTVIPSPPTDASQRTCGPSGRRPNGLAVGAAVGLGVGVGVGSLPSPGPPTLGA